MDNRERAAHEAIVSFDGRFLSCSCTAAPIATIDVNAARYQQIMACIVVFNSHVELAEREARAAIEGPPPTAWDLPRCIHGIVQRPAVVCRTCNPPERCILRQIAPGWEYICSKCKHEFSYIPIIDPDNLVPHFCPNCGAET